MKEGKIYERITNSKYEIIRNYSNYEILLAVRVYLFWSEGSKKQKKIVIFWIMSKFFEEYPE